MFSCFCMMPFTCSKNPALSSEILPEGEKTDKRRNKNNTVKRITWRTEWEYGTTLTTLCAVCRLWRSKSHNMVST